MATPMTDDLLKQLEELGTDEAKEIIEFVNKKKAELGDAATDEDFKELIEDFLLKQITSLFSDLFDDDEEDEEDEEAENIDPKLSANCKFVEGFFEKNDWHIDKVISRSDVAVYKANLYNAGVELKLSIQLTTDPYECSITALLPIKANTAFEYPLCKYLAKRNNTLRYGSFLYDERNLSISFYHRFFLNNDLDLNEFEIFFHIIASTSFKTFEDIRKYCMGEFDESIRDEILTEVNELVTDLYE